MNKMCVLFIGLLLTVHLSSQAVRAQATNATSPAPTTTTTANKTVSEKNGGERSAGAALWLPLALGLWVLHGWSN